MQNTCVNQDVVQLTTSYMCGVNPMLVMPCIGIATFHNAFPKLTMLSQRWTMNAFATLQMSAAPRYIITAQTYTITARTVSESGCGLINITARFSKSDRPPKAYPLIKIPTP